MKMTNHSAVHSSMGPLQQAMYLPTPTLRPRQRLSPEHFVRRKGSSASPQKVKKPVNSLYPRPRHRLWPEPVAMKRAESVQVSKSPKCWLRDTNDTLHSPGKRSRQGRRIKISDFIVLGELGRGRHGRVCSAIHCFTGMAGALKILQRQGMGTQGLQSVRKEIKIQAMANHPHIAQLYCVFADSLRIYLFMEMGTEGHLLDIVKTEGTLREETVSLVCRHLLQALAHVHQLGVIHRDVKPQNVVLVHGLPKLCDFGEASLGDIGQLRQTLAGTPLYLSPELLTGCSYDSSIDIWALGCMAHELLTGQHPFRVTHQRQLSRAVTWDFRMQGGWVEGGNFLSHCLRKRLQQRPSAQRLLRHPFILKWSGLETAEEVCR